MLFLVAAAERQWGKAQYCPYIPKFRQVYPDVSSFYTGSDRLIIINSMQKFGHFWLKISMIFYIKRRISQIQPGYLSLFIIS